MMYTRGLNKYYRINKYIYMKKQVISPAVFCNKNAILFIPDKIMIDYEKSIRVKRNWADSLKNTPLYLSAEENVFS